jgi:hypothetical protein
MTDRDDLTARAVRFAVETHRNNARRDLAAARDRLSAALASIADGDPSGAAFDALKAAQAAAEGAAHAGAWKAAAEIAALPEAERDARD